MVKHSKPSITIFTDASVYPEWRVAGWASWARGDGRAMTMNSGPLPFSNSETAELRAIAEAVAALLRTDYLSMADQSVMIQADNLMALQVLRTTMGNTFASKGREDSADIYPLRNVKKQYEVIARSISGMLGSKEVVYLRHIKSHKKGVHARSWVNETCDAMAKAAAQAQLQPPTQ